MTYNHIFLDGLPLAEKFPAFGLKPESDLKTGNAAESKIYACKKFISDGEFYAELRIDLEARTFEASVFDSATGERYTLFDVPSARGAFVGKLRVEVQGLVDEFRALCCACSDMHADYVDFIEKRFGVKADFPWADDRAKKESRSSKAYSDAAVFRCGNNKWFALIMSISYRQLLSKKSPANLPENGPLTGVDFYARDAGLDRKLHVVNLKADPEIIPELIDNRSVFPAYHMNKKHWITVALTAVTDFERLKELTEKSFEAVGGKSL